MKEKWRTPDFSVLSQEEFEELIKTNANSACRSCTCSACTACACIAYCGRWGG